MTIRQSLARIGATISALMLSACTLVGPNFETPQAPTLPDWSVDLDNGLDSGDADLARWWEVFEDPLLNELVDDALAANNTLEIAALSVLEARAQLGIATGSQWPQTQVAAGQSTLLSPPENTGVTSAYWQHTLGATVNWEIDFWGRYQRAIETANAAYLGSIASYQQARVLLTAAVVGAYAAVRTIEEQRNIAQENLALQQRSYDIAKVLYDQGQDSELDMQQAQTLLLATQSAIPAIDADLRKARNALSLLLGELPGSVTERLAAGKGIPVLPQSVSVGFPADMLRRRPDMRQAELTAMALNAQVGLAEADLYPSFSLAGSIGLASGAPGNDSFGDLFDGDAFSWSIGPSFVWPFLNYGRIRNNIRVQDARLQQALVNYAETALSAARETEDALADWDGNLEQAAILVQSVASARRSNELATLRYAEGYSDYQRVLDAQQALFSQQQRLVAAQGASVGSLIALYKALGGGWEALPGDPELDEDTRRQMTERTNWGDLVEAPDDAATQE
ncbi:efflux transporter outer membrane subunit [Marinihelvus fidelis]|uniref:Efflux transporter outer membrane subunit n=1 Tax=Marinihelvus fidelis TaxID=2613842 RepID=A0A5N0TD36_9GAMM|nr:efflux transporter outer membrane subunit [Marinihelvus fidelis]KAA9131977.1 efflux transporter outer membrane subunit [Marinihelvus fidelis]